MLHLDRIAAEEAAQATHLNDILKKVTHGR